MTRSIKNRKHHLRFLQNEALEDRRLLAITLEPLGTYSTGLFDESAAEIVAHDPANQRLFVTNVHDASVDILDISDAANPTRIGAIDTSSLGEEPTSVAVHNGLMAVAVRNDKNAPLEGSVGLYDISGVPVLVKSLTAGFGPDMLTFTPDGTTILVANQGRPSDNYEYDPEGSISVIDVSAGAAAATILDVGFTKYNGLENQLRDQDVRIFGPLVQDGQIVGQAPAANDLEPENISVSPDSTTAWITLQENNAIATLDIAAGEIVAVRGLGYKNHQAHGNGLDASDRDGGINIQNWRVKGMYQPDGIATYVAGDDVFLLTANEGNARGDEDGPFNEEARLKDVAVVPGLQSLQANDKLGRLGITTEPPHGKRIDKDGQVVLNQLFTFGTRSFSVWNSSADLVFDSGDQFEQIIAQQYPDHFNANDANDFDDGQPDNLDSRSDNKGPEPESVVTGALAEKTYAFVGLERMGGVMIYDVTNPTAPIFQSYNNRRDFGEPNTILVSQDPPVTDPETGDEVLVEITNPAAGDFAVEGMVFIAAVDSPTGTPLLVTANEVSGTTTIFLIVDDAPQSTVDLPGLSAFLHELAGANTSKSKAFGDNSARLGGELPTGAVGAMASAYLLFADNHVWQQGVESVFSENSTSAGEDFAGEDSLDLFVVESEI